MRFCPICQTRYDEAIIKFCTKDGTPLVEENPSFTAMPSQTSIEDTDEETVIRRNNPTEEFTNPPISNLPPRQKIIIPTSEEKKQTVRPLDKASYQQQPHRKSKTGITVALTVLGTMAVLAGAGGVWWWMSSKPQPTNISVNVNTSANNTNTDSNVLANMNTNVDINANLNTNINTNVNILPTPAPTPTRTPTPRPTPLPTATPNPAANINANAGNSAIPANSNTPTNNNRPPANTVVIPPSPRPSLTPPVNQNVNVGIINSRAASLPKPAYPPIAKQMGASGQVSVQVTIDESGNVLTAKAVSGNALLRAPSEAAARQSRFNPVKIGDRPVRATGTIIYNFINQ